MAEPEGSAGAVVRANIAVSLLSFIGVDPCRADDVTMFASDLGLGSRRAPLGLDGESALVDADGKDCKPGVGVIPPMPVDGRGRCTV